MYKKKLSCQQIFLAVNASTKNLSRCVFLFAANAGTKNCPVVFFFCSKSEYGLLAITGKKIRDSVPFFLFAFTAKKNYTNFNIHIRVNLENNILLHSHISTNTHKAHSILIPILILVTSIIINMLM